jgi:hypothetical protein
VVGCSLEGKSWDAEEEGEIEEEKVGRWVYIGFYRRNHQRICFVGIPVGKSTDDSTTSLYGDPSLNFFVIPSIKSYEKIHFITQLQLFKNLYNPSAI